MSKKHIKHDVFEKGLDPSKPHSLIGSDGRLASPLSPVVEQLPVQPAAPVVAEATPVPSKEEVKEETDAKPDLNVSKPKRVPPAKKKSTDNQT